MNLDFMYCNCLDNFSFLVKISSLLACHAIHRPAPASFLDYHGVSYLEICAVSLRACTDLMTIMFVCILIFLAKFSNCLDKFSFLVKLSSLLACHAILGRRHALQNMLCKVWCHLLPLLGGSKKSLFDKTVASLFTIFLLVSHVNI